MRHIWSKIEPYIKRQINNS